MTRDVEYIREEAEREADRMKRMLTLYNEHEVPGVREAQRLEYELLRFARRVRGLTAQLADAERIVASS